MALNGLQIQKLLPKTNCKECGSNTCLAFAMKLAAKKANLSECPYASDEAKAILGADSEPPVKAVTIGTGDKAYKVGGETVLYRHEKTFVSQTLIAVNINDDASRLDELLESIKTYKLERVGETLTINAIALTQKKTDTAAYAAMAKKVFDATGLPVIVRASTDAAVAAAAALKGSNSVLSGVTADSVDALKKAAEEFGHVLAATADSLDGVAALSEQLKAGNYTNILLQFGAESVAEAFQTNSIARRAALKDSYKALGYPTLRFIDTGDEMTDTVEAINEINKYGGMLVLPSFDPSQLVSLMTLRLNIFTDPQKPIQVEPKIYEIGEPGPDSPVFCTTNFSLTYFIVSGELENAGLSCWLAIPECEGFSVLTAWAAGKFSGASISKFIKESGIEDRLTRKRIVIPGYVSQISGELEEGLPGWQVLVGPQEAADLEAFIKSVLM